MILNRQDMMQAFKFLKPAIGENESRKNLMVVNVENKSPGWVTFTAANAFAIKRVKLPTHDTKKFFNFNINKPAICTFEKICRIDKSIEVATVTASALTCGDYSLKYRQQETEYPNLERLIGQEYDGKPTDNYAGFNHYMMEDCLYGFPNETGRATLKFWFKGRESPLKIESQCGNYMAMIMPVRIQW